MTKPRVLLPLGLILFAVACDDPKPDVKAAPSATASAKTAPVVAAPSAVPSAAPVAKKREFSCDAASITFNLPGLEQEVRKKTGKDAGTITKSDLATIKSINLTQGQVDYLDPCVFPYLTGVKDIFLGPGDLEDLKGLEPLTQLISLRAAINKVKDLKPLSRMTKLDRLDVSRSQVENIEAIGNMTDLTELALDDTLVEDLSPLAKCTKLERISIKGTRVKDLRPLLGLRKLKSLSIKGSPITDTNVLAPLRASGLKIEAG